MLRFIMILSFILAAAYMNVQIILQTEKHKNRNIIWFMMASADIAGTTLINKIYNILVEGIDIEFKGVINIFLLIVGLGTLVYISTSLIAILSRHGAKGRGGDLVLLMDAVLGVVILGLFLL